MYLLHLPVRVYVETTCVHAPMLSAGRDKKYHISSQVVLSLKVLSKSCICPQVFENQHNVYDSWALLMFSSHLIIRCSAGVEPVLHQDRGGVVLRAVGALAHPLALARALTIQRLS
mgnify:CR=1 FL=1